MKTLLFILFLCIPALTLAESHLVGNLIQGGLLHGRVTPGTRVFYGDRPVKVSAAGDFILGFGRDAEANHSLTLIKPSGDIRLEELQIETRDYRVQRIDGIRKNLLNPNAEQLQRISQEAALVAKARQLDSDRLNFGENFIWPLHGPITGIYGSQRILNGEPRRPHFGVDIAAPTGTPLVAPAGGRVTLAHPDMFFSGATLIIDHGHGLSSSFLHLQKILVTQGESLQQGQTIATVGASGRVTGPHLDWRVNWFEQRLDPALLVPEMPEK
jgi:murein DD-endopeptidase MepM/ murein hydrolase activator NlpD